MRRTTRLHRFPYAWALLFLAFLVSAPAARSQEAPQQRGRGLHGYIGYSASQPPDRAEYGMGMGFYSAAWSLIDQRLKHFQIGLASGWILPDNSD
ncbi:MAG: hypothetical protein ACYS26_16735, partial [Planctomycetota bacterium]